MTGNNARNNAYRAGGRPDASSHARLQGQRQSAQRFSLYMLALSMALLIALIGIYIGVMSKAASKNKEINELNARIMDAQNHNRNLTYSISKRNDQDLIRNTAVELGMTKPGPWSIRVMSLAGDLNSAGQAVYTVAAQQEGQ